LEEDALQRNGCIKGNMIAMIFPQKTIRCALIEGQTVTEQLNTVNIGGTKIPIEDGENTPQLSTSLFTLSQLI